MMTKSHGIPGEWDFAASREPIEIADERVGNIRISVTCPSDRIDETVAALARSLWLKVERHEAGGIVLRAGD